MSPERGGGINSSVRRLHLARAQMLVGKIEVSYISANPGHEVTEEKLVLQSTTLPPADLRKYELQPDGSFRIPPIKPD